LDKPSIHWFDSQKGTDYVQRVELFRNYHVNIHCPFCGALVKDMSENAAEPYRPCPHTLFLAHDEGFEYLSERAAVSLDVQSIEEAMEREESVDELTDKVTVRDAVKFAAYVSPPGQFGDYVGFATIDEE
jgi:hypothetical protein